MKLRPFELFLVIVFIALFFLALVLLSGYKRSDSGEAVVVGEVSVWGTLDQALMEGFLSELALADPVYKDVSYQAVSPDQFERELTNALADGYAPDVVLLPHEALTTLRRRIQPLSYDAFPLRDVKDQYVDGAAVFALSDGLYAYPIMLDPLMLYFNRSLLSSEGFLSPPATWESLVNEQLPTLIKRNPDRSIERSVVALGEYQNVTNAFAILSTLLLQAGSQGVVNEKDTVYRIELNRSPDGNTEPLRVAADFYTRFGQPNNSLYSWNRSFESDRDRFLGGQLVFYFGKGSEGTLLEAQNPNLDFDIAEVPQGAAATVRRTYATFYGAAALRTSDNLSGAAVLMARLSADDTAGTLARLYGMVPAKRSLVASGSNDTYGRLTYKSAAVAYGWLTPSQAKTDDIFNTLTKDINENRRDTNSAVNDALGRFELEYN